MTNKSWIIWAIVLIALVGLIAIGNLIDKKLSPKKTSNIMVNNIQESEEKKDQYKSDFNPIKRSLLKSNEIVVYVIEIYDEVEITVKSDEWYKLDEKKKIATANDLYKIVREYRGPWPVSIYDQNRSRVAFSFGGDEKTTHMEIIR